MTRMMWQCEACGEVHSNEAFANACCAEVAVGYQCEECGEFYGGIDSDEDAKKCTHGEDEDEDDE